MTEITTPVGRLVGGHPLDQRPNIDEKTGIAKLQKDKVTPSTSAYVGLAIAKGGETHWNQTEWGQQLQAAGVQAWPNGAHGAPTFAWKVTDGDSQVPNKKGKKPCEREGYPGHWVLNASTGLAIRSFHAGRYDPTQQIQNKAEIKPGDYCRLVLDVKGNNSTESPGIYLNPSLFELTRAGIEIVLASGPDAAAAFGAAGAGQMPANALVDTAIPAAAEAAAAAPPPAGAAAAPPPAEAVTPAPDFLAPEKTYDVKGTQYTEAQLKASKWSDAQITALGQ